MSNGTGPSRWKVISQRQTVDLLPDGSVGQVVEVTFTLYDGTTGRVSVPVRGFSAQSVAAAIDAYADHLEAVARLEG